MDWTVVGIDPAPTKPTVAYSDGGYEYVKPRSLRSFIMRLVKTCERLLIAWDAPLSFDHSDFYDRPIDKIVRQWARTQTRTGRFAEGAINVRSFAGLPHWAISCDALGMPFGSPPAPLRLAPVVLDPGERGAIVIEVHPAVALGAWWLSAQGLFEPFPRYKGNGLPVANACTRIAHALQFPASSGESDDRLDAFAAYRLGELFCAGHACWPGDPHTGGYVMPLGAVTDELTAALSVATRPPSGLTRISKGAGLDNRAS